ncbi:MAG TPA: universal stress protein [Acidimicrobiales bacterium]|nr:universal stress protein [Acidimicrobiales bacterium]
MRRVIAAIDNSAASRPVLAMAQAVASALGGTLDVVHVTEDGDETAGASAQAAGATLRTLSGDPIEQLALEVAGEDVVALVLGARGGLRGPRPAGHLALTLAGRTDKPVVVVPPGAHPPQQLRKVLVAMEGTPGKARALARTIELSTGAGLEIVVLHVDEEVPSFTDQVQHETEAYAREFLARHILGAPQARLELRIGVPAVEVLGAVESLQPELLAVGWPHTADAGRGAVAREILDRSTIPVLLVAVT